MDYIKKPPESEIKRMNEYSMRWLMGKVLYMQKHQKFPGAINVKNYINQRLFGVGDMFLFHYDPKWKAKLPYYDTFPLVIPIDVYGDGFLGLNLHYLPPDLRMNFINRLIKYTTIPIGDSRSRMQISYDMLKSSNKLNAYLPCVKRYLSDHVRGQLLRILPTEWPLVVNIPCEAFQKSSKQQVWNDSRRII